MAPKRTSRKVASPKLGKTARAEQHELFCLEFVKDRNAARAARAAGYSEKGSAQQGYDLLTYPHIKKRVSDLTAELLSKVKLEGEEAMLRIQTVGVFDPRRMFDSKGCVLPPTEWPDDVAAAVAGFEVRETYHPKSGRFTGYVKKVKLKDGLRAMEDMAQHLGQLKPAGDVNVNVPVTVVDEKEVRKMREKIKADC